MVAVMRVCGMRTGITVDVKAADRARLEAIVADRNSPQKHVWRARIVLLTADGLGTNEIMRQTAKSKTCLWRWQERFMQTGVEGLLHDRTRPSRVPPLPPAIGERVVALTQSDPPGETTHWTAAAMAGLVRISVSSVQRIWRSHGLQPHRVRQFKLSRDPEFIPKLRDIVGLYIDPPAHAMVLSVDEKSQIQALDRSQPGLPLKPGRCGTMTHDYKRNGTTTLFAALDTLQGKVVGECHERHRHQEFLKFLRRLDTEFPGDVPLHLIMDNYGTHKHAKVKAWLKRHPRFVSHFVPTSSSWMNLVERWFGHLDNKAIRRGVFLSVADLQASIAAFLQAWNENPQPFVWTATVESIQEKLTRCRRTLEQIQPGCTSPKSGKRQR